MASSTTARDRTVIQVIPASAVPEQEAQAEASPPVSWVPSWLNGSPIRSSIKDKSHKKNISVGFENPSDVNEGRAVRRNFSLGASDAPQRPRLSPSVSMHDKRTRHESVVIPMDGSGDASQNTPVVQEPPVREVSRRKGKAAPPVPSGRGPSVRSNFSYDTLKEKADVWKKERNKRPGRNMLAEQEEIPFRDIVRDKSRTLSEFHAASGEESQRPKICFTKEESDKVDADILRLMDALQENRYPFNRDKHLLFNKLRLIRRKQMGLLFAHKELDHTGYFNTDKTEFGYDVVAEKLGIMHNVIDAISRDVYELRELLYYERKNQTPPNRRGSSDRRSSSEPPSRSAETSLFRPVLEKNSSHDQKTSSQTARRKSLKAPAANNRPSVLSPTRPILKHAKSDESFKSAKSEESP
ncbi:uncharacterized protein LOC129589252 [Paramacrobiotus metropolitanus]|uniref:uncharacterized protein LOC129589252 n=1 Tax=Paramacrobiotus metropolitanus TaxID=2943436 RepID=UPI002445D6FF|nr:uncharacterized protein LOC129589252 [Paramacrobiotus metropolitanus]